MKRLTKQIEQKNPEFSKALATPGTAATTLITTADPSAYLRLLITESSLLKKAIT